LEYVDGYITKYPGYREPYLEKADILIALEEYEKAMEACNVLLDRDAEDIGALGKKERCVFQTG